MQLTASAIQPFIDYLKFEKRYSSHTVISYQTDLLDFKDFVDHHYGPVNLNEVTHPIIRSWLANQKERGMAAKSILRKIAALRSFFKYQLRSGAIAHTPMAQIVSPKAGKRLPVFVKEQETSDLLKSLEGATEDWKSLNANMLLTLFYNTGMRLSELINLKDKQIDSARSHIKVLGKGNKERIIPVSNEVLKQVSLYQQLKKRQFEHPDDFFLVTERGKKLYPKYAYLLVKKYLSVASTLEKKSPHVLRHTFATHLMNGGADLNAVKELLGHSSLASTQVYTHNTIEKLKDVHKKAHPKA